LWLKFKLPLLLSSSYYYSEVTVKISKFLWITGIINRALKPSQVQKHIRLKTYNTLAYPTLLYRCEIGQFEQIQDDMSRNEIMGRMVKYTWQD